MRNVYFSKKIFIFKNTKIIKIYKSDISKNFESLAKMILLKTWDTK